MKELVFAVDSVTVTSKSLDEKIDFKLLNDDEKDLKLVLKATFTKDIPNEWKEILGRVGDTIRIVLGAKNQQETLE